jgi:hypothetical protein
MNGTDGVVPPARVQRAGVGDERLGLQGQKLLDQPFEARGLDVRVVGLLADVDLHGGEVVLLEAVPETPCPEQGPGLLRNRGLAFGHRCPDEIHLRTQLLPFPESGELRPPVPTIVYAPRRLDTTDWV